MKKFGVVNGNSLHVCSNYKKQLCVNNLLSKPVYNYLNLYVGDLDLYLGGLE